MSDGQQICHQGKREEYAIYTGQASACFVPGLAGVTYPDPSYEIYRPRADCYVFEYVLSGTGHVRQDKESATRSPSLQGTPTFSSQAGAITTMRTARIPGQKCGSM